MANPIGIIFVVPGFKTNFLSKHARRSSPAEPFVSYFGKGILLPINELIIFNFIFIKYFSLSHIFDFKPYMYRLRFF